MGEWVNVILDCSMLRAKYTKSVKLRVPSVKGWVFFPRKLVGINTDRTKIRARVCMSWTYRGESQGESLEIIGSDLVNAWQEKSSYVPLVHPHHFHHAPVITKWKEVLVDDSLKR